MGEAGIFGGDHRLELIEGEIVEMSPIGRRHAARVRRLINLLARRLDEDAANLADEYGKRDGASWTAWESDLDDGNTVHAEVGSYRANGFGLHDVHGNIWEWCLDGYDQSAYGSDRGQDPVVPWEGSASRVFRGGGFYFTASYARSALRRNYTPEDRDNYLGLRPARASQLATDR